MTRQLLCGLGLLALVHAPSSAHALTYAMSVSGMMGTGYGHYGPGNTLPVPTSSLAATVLAEASLGAVEAVYVPPAGSSYVNGRLDFEDAAVSGRATSSARVTLGLTDMGVDPDLVHWGNGFADPVQAMKWSYRGGFTLTSNDSTWAGVSIDLNFRDAVTGDLLETLVRTGNDSNFWFKKTARLTVGLAVGCGSRAGGSFGDAGVLAVIAPGPVAVVADIQGAAGPADCGGDPIFHDVPDAIAAAIAAGAVPAPVPLPATVLLLATALTGSAAWRALRRRLASGAARDVEARTV